MPFVAPKPALANFGERKRLAEQPNNDPPKVAKAGFGATNGNSAKFCGVEQFDFAALQVPGEDGVYYCARHKTTQTRLRCGRCEKPICPKCTLMGPTGARCRDCLSNRSAHIYQVSPGHYALSFGAGVVLGAIGAALSSALGSFAFWILLYAPAIGPLLGRLVTQITRGKRGPKLAFAVSLGLTVGVLAAAMGGSFLLFQASLAEAGAAPATMGKAALPGLLLMMAISQPFLWIFLVVAIIGVFWWLK